MKKSIPILSCLIVAFLGACGEDLSSKARLNNPPKDEKQLQRTQQCARNRFTSSAGAAIPLNSHVLGNTLVAQSFVPTVDVRVNQLNLNLDGWDKDGSKFQSLLTISVASDRDNAPSPDAALAARSELREISLDEASYEFKLDVPVDLIAGTRYWIVLESSVASLDREVRWASGTGNPEGAGFSLYKKGTEWKNTGIVENDAVYSLGCASGV